MTAATMVPNNRVVPALRKQPGTRPTPLEGADMPNDTCSIDECQNAIHGRGMCLKHYTRAYRHGDPMAVRGKVLDAEPQFDPPKADGSCSIEGCSSPARSNGWCKKHHTRWQRHGDPLLAHGEVGWEPPTLGQRFWQYVDPPATPGGCWEWNGSTSSRNRGRLRGQFYARVASKRKALKAYRVAYELMVGPIPDGLDIDHLCRNPICVNPAHLDAVPGAVNQQRQKLSATAHRAIIPGHMEREATHAA